MRIELVPPVVLILGSILMDNHNYWVHTNECDIRFTKAAIVYIERDNTYTAIYNLGQTKPYSLDIKTGNLKLSVAPARFCMCVNNPNAHCFYRGVKYSNVVKLDKHTYIGSYKISSAMMTIPELKRVTIESHYATLYSDICKQIVLLEGIGSIPASYAPVWRPSAGHRH